MAQTTLVPFDSSIQATNSWLNEIKDRLGWQEPYHAYYALRAVLHAIRDRLPVDQVAALGGQLPMVVRGFYYEDWHPNGKCCRDKDEEFIEQIAAAFGNDPEIVPQQVARAVLQVLSRHVAAGDFERVRRILPSRLRA